MERQVGEGPEGVFEAIWAQAAKVLPAESFSIALSGPGPGQITYVLAVERGVRQVSQTRELGDGLSEVVIRTGRPLLVRNFELERGTLPLSWMGAPLIIGGKVQGLISVQSYRHGAFDQKDLSILSMLAGWAASSIESARRYKAQQQEAEASTALLRAARALGRETEQAGLFRAVAEIVPSLVACERCFVLGWDPELELFRTEWRWNALDRRPEQITLPPVLPSQSAAVSEMLSRTDVVVVPGSQMDRLGLLGDLVPLETGVVVLVPLTVDGDVVGMVVAARSEQGEGLSAREEGILRGLADIVGLALLSQRLHRQAGEAAALRELNDLKSRVISTISHELRTPLSFVQAGSELLMQRLFDPEQLRQVAGLVNQGAVRLAEVVDDVIEFADLQSGVVRLSPQLCQVPSVLRDAIAEATTPADAHRVLLEVVEPLPTVVLDRDKLKSVVVRLVRNAISFSQDPAPVQVRASMDGRELKVEVRDAGFGIPPEEMERMFDPFFRGEVSQSRCISGTGLGLSIVKQLVDLMGGRLSVESEVNKGTSVMVAVPVEGAEGEAPARDKEPGHAVPVDVPASLDDRPDDPVGRA